MTSRLVALEQEARQPAGLARFWGRLLGREPVETAGGVLLPGDARQVSLRFVPGENVGDPLTSLLHLHLTSTSPADQERLVAAALALGGRHLDVGQRPEEGHVVLADPEGNPFCVIEPGNRFLAGCGRLGELACDGSREVGLFWSAALGWPLVWDEGEETAVQSPLGGTKVAWGGLSDPPRDPAQSRQRFTLAVVEGDLSTELERLVTLGAAVGSEPSERTAVLTDPDGYTFTVTAS